MEEEKQLAYATANVRSYRQRPPSPKAEPWLVFPHGKGRKFQSFYNPCEPNNRNCTKSIPEMRGKAYYHKTCHQGWLIVFGDVQDSAEYSVAKSNLDDCFLWNPVSLKIIQLPNLDRPSITIRTKLPSKDFYLFDCPCNILVFCRPGDKQWRTKALDERYYSNNDDDTAILECIQSLLCFKEIEIQKLWQNVVVDKKTQNTRSFKVQDAGFPVIIGDGDKNSECMDCWVESGNEIFKIHFNRSTRSYRRVTSTHILKLDFSTLSWVLLKNLDDHVLFLCISMDDGLSRKCYSTSTASCSAVEMGLERGYPMHNNDKYLMRIPDELLAGATIRYSKDGWLYCLAMIRLPDLPDDYVLGGMSFSSTPTSHICVVIAMSNWSPWSSKSGYAEVSFLVSDLRKGWTAHLFEYKYDTHDRYMQDIRHDFMPCINNPVFYNGVFYCLDYNGLLGVFTKKGGGFSWKVLPKSLGQFNGIYPSFLMAWVELTILGKHAIFISYTSSFSAVSPRSFMENKIYLMRLYGDRILYYSLDTCRYHCVGSNRHSSQDFHNTKEISNCTWIQPNWSVEPDD
ncbi:hypothetical protein MKX01_004607 [Papaver californicum]|nr:hypothetical protein MKX01_004607 [Papaver californicum]